MAIPQSTVDAIMADCGRHCCICRRFAPLHLQVHHIVEQADGGTDHRDNLIPICLTCHSDVHTQTKLTRRFTVSELKQHRDNVYRLSAAGTLPPQVAGAQDFAAHAAEAAAETVELSPIAVRILYTAANATTNPGLIMIHPEIQVVIINGAQLVTGESKPREFAAWKGATEQLWNAGYIEPGGGSGYFRINHEGYLLADQLVAMGAVERP